MFCDKLNIVSGWWEGAENLGQAKEEAQWAGVGGNACLTD